MYILKVGCGVILVLSANFSARFITRQIKKKTANGERPRMKVDNPGTLMA